MNSAETPEHQSQGKDNKVEQNEINEQSGT